MQTSPIQTREDIETAIEDCKETIYEHKYAIRWFLRGIHVCQLGIAIGFAVFVIIFPFNISYLQSLFAPIGGIAVALVLFIGLGLGITYNDDSSIGKHLKGIREGKRTLTKLLHHLATFDELALRHLSPEHYMHQLPILIKAYRKRADRYRNSFIVIQLITIFMSAGITSLSGGWLDKYLSIPWIIPVIGVLISILTSLTLFFKFREKGTNLQQTADTMDWEHMACTLEIGKYKGIPEKERLILLAETAENLRQEQQKRQLQLEQTSHAEQKALQSSS